MSVVSPVRDGLLVPPFSPVSDPRLEWNVGLFSLEPDAAPYRSTQETSAEDKSWADDWTDDWTASRQIHTHILNTTGSDYCWGPVQNKDSWQDELKLFCFVTNLWSELDLNRETSHTHEHWTKQTDNERSYDKWRLQTHTHTHRFVQMINRTVWLWD